MAGVLDHRGVDENGKYYRQKGSDISNESPLVERTREVCKDQGMAWEEACTEALITLIQERYETPKDYKPPFKRGEHAT